MSRCEINRSLMLEWNWPLLTASKPSSWPFELLLAKCHITWFTTWCPTIRITHFKFEFESISKPSTHWMCSYLKSYCRVIKCDLLSLKYSRFVSSSFLLRFANIFEQNLFYSPSQIYLIFQLHFKRLLNQSWMIASLQITIEPLYRPLLSLQLYFETHCLSWPVLPTYDWMNDVFACCPSCCCRILRMP